jgi:hypothetical protein
LLEINQSETRIACGGHVCERVNEPTLGRSIYGLSSIQITHFDPTRSQTWPPHAILVSDWLISSKYSPLKPLRRIFLEVDQSETRIACGGHVCKRIGLK